MTIVQPGLDRRKSVSLIRNLGEDDQSPHVISKQSPLLIGIIYVLPGSPGLVLSLSDLVQEAPHLRPRKRFASTLDDIAAHQEKRLPPKSTDDENPFLRRFCEAGNIGNRADDNVQQSLAGLPPLPNTGAAGRYVAIAKDVFAFVTSLGSIPGPIPANFSIAVDAIAVGTDIAEFARASSDSHLTRLNRTGSFITVVIDIAALAGDFFPNAPVTNIALLLKMSKDVVKLIKQFPGSILTLLDP